MSYIYPPPPATGFNCDFEINGDCNNWNLWTGTQTGWDKQISIFTRVPEIISDHRWESKFFTLFI